MSEIMPPNNHGFNLEKKCKLRYGLADRMLAHLIRPSLKMCNLPVCDETD